MNKKKFFKAFGLAMVAAAAFGITACDDSSSSPVNVDQFAEGDLSSGNDTLSSAQPTSSETAQPTSSENGKPTSSANAQPASSGSNPASSGAVAGSSSSTVNGSSSSQVGSSSSVNPNSSSSKENCLHMPHFADSLHITYQVPVCTAEEELSRRTCSTSR